MKKIILILIAAALLLCSCRPAEKNRNSEFLREVEELRQEFSMLYGIIFKNGESIPAYETEEAIYTSAGFSFLSDDYSEQDKYIAKVYYYLKRSLILMENIRVNPEKNEKEQERIVLLDKTVNRLCHMLNIENKKEALRALNDGVYLLGEITDGYGEKKDANILKMEYCLNLLEIEASDEARFSEAIDLTEQILKELSEIAGVESEKEIIIFWESISSLKDAAKYRDEKLIRMKVELMRANLDKIALQSK